MTMSNVIVTSTAGHLMADALTRDVRTDLVVEIGDKVTVLPKLKAVVFGAGLMPVPPFRALEAITDLGDLPMTLHLLSIAQWLGSEQRCSDMPEARNFWRGYLAWSDATQSVEGGFLKTADHFGPMGVAPGKAAYEPFDIAPMPPVLMSPPPGVDFDTIVGRPITRRQELDGLDVPKIGRSLAELQRQSPDAGLVDRGGRAVGGWCDLFTVSARGVERQRLVTWPQDRVGERMPSTFKEAERG